MSEASEKARSAMKSKAKRMAEGHNEKVDASDWEPGQTFSAEKKKGPRPLNPREYKRGGKVVEQMHGEKPGRNATKMSRHPTHGCRTENKANYEGGTRPTGGRIARATGGATTLKDMPIPKIENRDGRKHGGKAHADEAQDKKLIKREVKEDCMREGRKHGGKTGKGKTNINIIIGGGHRDGGQQQPSQPPMAPPPQPIRPPGFMPPGAGAMPPGAGAPPPMAMPPPGMGRKSGGRAKSYKDMEFGAGSGLGREQKTEIEKSK